MLLQRLTEYGKTHRDGVAPFHVDREFRWKLDIRTRNGEIVRVDLVEETDPDRPGRGVVHTVPASTRTVGASPNLTADDAQYVLGWGDDTTKAPRVAVCHSAYLDLLRRWAAAVDADLDPVPHILVALYSSGRIIKLSRPETILAKHGVLTAIDGHYAYASATAASFWQTEVADSKGSGRADICLSCGNYAPLAKTIPGTVPAPLVPGATNSAALVSVNKRVFGYDLVEQLTHTPICLTCADDTMVGLVGVLSAEHAVTYGGQDTRLAWWATDPGEPTYADHVLRADPSQVTTLLESIHEGRPSPRRKAARFCWLAVGGNVARVMVRDWIDMPLTSDDPDTPSLDRNIKAWFDDHENTPRRSTAHTLPDGTLVKPGRRWHGVTAMLAGLGRWDRDARRYAQFGAKNADRASGASRDLLRAAHLGAPLPVHLRAHLLHRIRNDRHVDDVRASLIRLGLTRCPRTKDNPVPKTLDENHRDPAYLAGRLFAVLADTQRVAHRPPPNAAAGQGSVGQTAPGPATQNVKQQNARNEVNSTFEDRYFVSAVTNPRLALVRGRTESKAWLGKIRRRQSEGRAHYFRSRLDTLYGLVDETTGLPARCSLRQQEQFILGYHHQRENLYHTPTKPEPSVNDEKEAAL